MSRTRQAIDDAINGDAGKVDAATLRALKVIGTAVDDIDERISSIQARIATLIVSVAGSVIAGIVLFVATKK